MDINKLGVTINATITNVSATATYGTVAANGRGTVDIPSVSASPAAPSLNSAVFYLISPDKMYILETDGKTNGGVAEKQTNAATLLTGTLAFNLAQLATGGSDSSFSGQAVTNLTNLSGIMDSNVAINNIESQASSVLTGSFNPTDLHGRGTAAIQLGQLGTSTPNSGFYLVTPTKMVVFGLQSAVGSFQAVDGVIENQ